MNSIILSLLWILPRLFLGQSGISSRMIQPPLVIWSIHSWYPPFLELPSQEKSSLYRVSSWSASAQLPLENTHHPHLCCHHPQPSACTPSVILYERENTTYYTYLPRHHLLQVTGSLFQRHHQKEPKASDHHHHPRPPSPSQP